MNQSRFVIPSLLVILIVSFLHRNILEIKSAVPFDLLYAFEPWRGQASTSSAHRNPELLDQVVQFYPWWKLIVDEVRHGRFPLWNPYSFGGSPLLANGQSGVFYPLNVLNFICSPATTSVLLLFARLFAAGIFTFAFLRQLGLSKHASLLGAVVFTFNRNMIVWLGFPAANAAILLPALFWAAERLLKRITVRNFVLAACLVAAQFFAGQPQTSLVSAFALSTYVVLRLTGDKRPWVETGRIALAYAGAWVLGACLAAIQLLPMLEYMKESAAWAFRSQFNLKVYPWYELISFVIPNFFGTPYDGNYWGFANLVGTSCYIGVVPLILSLISLLSVRIHASLRNFWIIALLCGGIVYKVPLLAKITALPLFNAMDTNKFLVGIVFSLVVCFAVEFDRILGDSAPRVARKALLVSGVLLTFALVIHFYFRDFSAALGLRSYQARNLTVFLLLALAGLLLLHLREQGRLNRSVLWLFLALMYSDLFIFGHSYNAVASPGSIGETPKAIAALQKDLKSFRLLGTNNALPPNTSILYGVADIRGYDALTPSTYFNFISRLQPSYADLLPSLDLDEPAGRITSSTLFKREIIRMFSGMGGENLRDLIRRAYYWNTNLDNLITSKALDAFSVRYILSGTSIVENPHALPRVYLRREFDVTDEQSALQIVSQPDFDFNRRLLISGVDEREAFQRPFAAADSSPAEDRAEIAYQDPSHVEISLETAGVRILVLTDMYFPGWKAYLDGKAIQIYPANYLFRAVLLPDAGKHRVRFAYNPPSFTAGATITASGALICLILFAL